MAPPVPDNPYDEFPYRSVPVEWTAPERLALTSLLHGGPRVSSRNYRYLELGCGDATNLLPLAYYRPHSTFIGLDGSRLAMDRAEQRRAELAIDNLHLVHSTLLGAGDVLDGQFDFIVAHGVFSWISDQERRALLALCSRFLHPAGLLYVNYNARPGWTVRGMVRDLLRSRLTAAPTLRERAEMAQALAHELAAELPEKTGEGYLELMRNELRFVAGSDPSYIAHEYLSPENHAYWRSEFAAMAARHGFCIIADADYNYPSGRVALNLSTTLERRRLTTLEAGDLVDLLSYRQLHSPVLTFSTWQPQQPTDDEFAALHLAACLISSDECGSPNRYVHPHGGEVESRDVALDRALRRLLPVWPDALPLRELFADPAQWREDLELLHRHGMIDLRAELPVDARRPCDVLHASEAAWGSHRTSPHHMVEVLQPCG